MNLISEAGRLQSAGRTAEGSDWPALRAASCLPPTSLISPVSVAVSIAVLVAFLVQEFAMSSSPSSTVVLPAVSAASFPLPAIGGTPATLNRHTTTPGSFALPAKIAPDATGATTFSSPDTPGMPAPSEKTAWDFLPDGWKVKRVADGTPWDTYNPAACFVGIAPVGHLRNRQRRNVGSRRSLSALSRSRNWSSRGLAS